MWEYMYIPNPSNMRLYIREGFNVSILKRSCDFMASTKDVEINGVNYSLQSCTYSWYANLTDLYLNPSNGRRNTAKYTDLLIKGCVIAPAEVAKGGIKYFDDRDDLMTPGELAREIENFLAERDKPGKCEKTSAN